MQNIQLDQRLKIILPFQITSRSCVPLCAIRLLPVLTTMLYELYCVIFFKKRSELVPRSVDISARLGTFIQIRDIAKIAFPNKNIKGE